MKQTKLTTRQWLLYAYLKDHKNEWKQLEEILCDRELRALYPLPRPTTEFNNRADRRQLTDDITALKNSDVIQVIILSNSKKGIKIASEEEYLEMLQKEKISCLKKLKQTYKQLEKASLNNQMRLVFGREKNVIESLFR